MTDTAGDVSVLCVVGDVLGVTQLHDVVYIVNKGWSSTISRFNARTHQRLTDIKVNDLRQPWDIVACERTCYGGLDYELSLNMALSDLVSRGNVTTSSGSIS